MDNQQERSVALSWVAGLLTGEGTFTVGVLKTKTGYRATPIVSIAMRDHDTMLSLAHDLKSIGLPFHIQERKSGMMTLKATGIKRVHRYCQVLIPYLRGDKKRSAEMVLEFIDSRLSKPQNSLFSLEEASIVRRLREHHGSKHPSMLPPTEILRGHTLDSAR